MTGPANMGLLFGCRTSWHCHAWLARAMRHTLLRARQGPRGACFRPVLRRLLPWQLLRIVLQPTSELAPQRCGPPPASLCPSQVLLDCMRAVAEEQGGKSLAQVGQQPAWHVVAPAPLLLLLPSRWHAGLCGRLPLSGCVPP